ncbi:helix-turn-helix domain-containing protein [Paracoccus spongiarum]|uniref:Helix-turn-helix domain-containing protein n=1 Tax=Paracoccus spongiarum TaxID=3064387 RepID=A0ABT9JBR0_9RHOB|nr:helix-turn-helix domain-containing protein [Paracoccus sp. 2205BS29-5]MDP5307248.1 helix-turn-helix domain-containing protein [Paracoccus sp. 2205BS29-5]
MSDRLTEIDTALAEINVMRATMTRLESAINDLRDELLQHSLSQLPSCDVLPTQHRREHRPGRTPIIDTDAELQAFILARLDRLTYHQIAAEVASHFPPDRHISHATVHRWARKQC